MCILHQIVAGLGSIISGIVHKKKLTIDRVKFVFNWKIFLSCTAQLGQIPMKSNFTFLNLKPPHFHHNFSRYMMWSSNGFTNLVFTNPEMFSPTFSSKLIYVYRKRQNISIKKQFRIRENKVLETISWAVQVSKIRQKIIDIREFVDATSKFFCSHNLWDYWHVTGFW